MNQPVHSWRTRCLRAGTYLVCAGAAASCGAGAGERHFPVARTKTADDV